MDLDIDRTWKEFAKDVLDDKNATLRKGSGFKKAAPWVNGLPGPAMPTQMMSNVDVFDSWQNPQSMAQAKKIVGTSSITVKALVEELIKLVTIGKITYPYLWWLWPYSSNKRAIYQDANGITFVKLNNKWHLAYPVRSLGALVGSQGSNYEDLPLNAYFVSWENENIARQHIT